MFRIVGEEVTELEVIQMHEMEPLTIGQIVNAPLHGYKDAFVMRTASTEHFEVMNLSAPEEDSCWTDKHTDIEVRILHPSEYVTITLFNGTEKDMNRRERV
jgi:hypothetical protein